jgi:cytochrome c-type biogenesis protein CcmH/NrfG
MCLSRFSDLERLEFAGLLGSGGGLVGSKAGHLATGVALMALILGATGCGRSVATGPAAADVATPEHATLAADSIAWPGLTAASTVAAPAGSADRVPPVSSMVAGLRERLEQSPDDAKGWALLAQSYAHMGDPVGAAQATARAVALGMDEQNLRRRIEAAAPKPDVPTDWVQQALTR